MRALSEAEVLCVGGAGAGQDIYQCMKNADDQMGWIGIAITFASAWQPGLGAAYTTGLFAGCAIVYMTNC